MHGNYFGVWRVIPRISLVSQCYAEYPLNNLDPASDQCFSYRSNKAWVNVYGSRTEGIFFLADSQIPMNFLVLGATNSSGYTPKLVLMLSAVKHNQKQVTTGRSTMTSQ